MSETRSPTEALLNFANWMKPLDGDQTVQKIYGLTAADAFAVLAQLAAETKARTNAEFELLALRDEVAKLNRPITGEELRIDAAEVELRAEMLADEGEEPTVPLRDYNELLKNALALDAEWMERLAAAEARATRLVEELQRYRKVRAENFGPFNPSRTGKMRECEAWSKVLALLTAGEEAKDA